jgi:SnoaL-like domain
MTPVQIVNRFYELNNAIPAGKATPEELEVLLAPDFVFAGPLMKVESAASYMAMLRQFLPFHESVRVVRQIADDDDVCSTTELKLKTPAGGSLVLDIVEWISVEAGKLKTHTIYYDPRAFVQAFPMQP